ncbi:MAG: carbohydrate ABC transporter permease, partial [Proteobacteria bacterium]
MSSQRATLRTSNIIILTALILLSLLWLLPIISVLLTAVRSQGDLFKSGIFGWPKTFRWDNFLKAWDAGDFSIYFKNSLFVILMKVPLGILVSSLAAYPLAKMSFRMNQPIFLFFLIGLAVPIQVALQPLVVMMRELGLSNTLFALLPPYIAFGIPLQV